MNQGEHEFNTTSMKRILFSGENRKQAYGSIYLQKATRTTISNRGAVGYVNAQAFPPMSVPPQKSDAVYAFQEAAHQTFADGCEIESDQVPSQKECMLKKKD